MRPILLKVKKIGESEFEITYQENRQIKSLNIVEKRLWIEEIEEFISSFNSDSPIFYEIWGYSEFRESVSNSIADLRTKSPQLQAA